MRNISEPNSINFISPTIKTTTTILMDRIDNAQISDFKGIRNVELEFGDVNLITGRNNTGKSSILEALELASEPKVMSKYGSDLSDIININSDEAEILLNIDGKKSSCSLSHPSSEETIETLLDYVENSTRRNYPGPSRGSPLDEVFEEDILEEVAKQQIRSMSDEAVSNAQKHLMNIIIEGTKYRFLPRGIWTVFISPDEIDHITKYIENNYAEKVEELQEIFEWPIPDLIERNLHYKFTTSGRSGGIFLEEPPSLEVLEYIREPMMNEEPSSAEDEDIAVKKVRVRDYLREREIVENLEDFDFDDLVFDENGHQYSIPYNFMGDGFKTIVGIVWQFVGESEFSDVLLLEEPENHMHPGYISHLVPFLIQVARREDIQLFMTTHNIDFIMEFFSDNLDNERDFLENGLKLIQMSELVPKQFDYEDARSQMKDIHNDLRGI